MFSLNGLSRLLLGSASLALALPVDTVCKPPTVQIKNGSYYGVYNAEYDQDFFLGMPYSQPPVGELRFRVPQPLNTAWAGVRNATQYSHECIGYGSDQWTLGNYISEDCLTLNVVRPAGISSNAALPVVACKLTLYTHKTL
jgi:carboxylesterase type B